MVDSKYDEFLYWETYGVDNNLEHKDEVQEIFKKNRKRRFLKKYLQKDKGNLIKKDNYIFYGKPIVRTKDCRVFCGNKMIHREVKTCQKYGYDKRRKIEKNFDKRNLNNFLLNEYIPMKQRNCFDLWYDDDLNYNDSRYSGEMCVNYYQEPENYWEMKIDFWDKDTLELIEEEEKNDNDYWDDYWDDF